MTRYVNDKDTRLEDARERLGTDEPVCGSSHCNETNPLVLTGQFPDILCYECRCSQQGRSPVERHHPDGQHNHPDTIPLLGNDHRLLSDAQRDWPLDTFRNPRHSPLLRASGQVRGFLDLLQLLIDRILGWIPLFLEWLDGVLTDQHGDLWWQRLGWADIA